MISISTIEYFCSDTGKYVYKEAAESFAGLGDWNDSAASTAGAH